MIAAVEMEKEADVPAKKFRNALREQKFIWHVHNDRWTVPLGSGVDPNFERTS